MPIRPEGRAKITEVNDEKVYIHIGHNIWSGPFFLLLSGTTGRERERAGKTVHPGMKKNNGSGLWSETGGRALFTKRLSIGVFEGDENEMFHNPMDVAVDGTGNIYILDAGHHRIQKFDKRGKYLLTIGRRGAGPGEILGARDIEVDSKGNIVVFDGMANRISLFNNKGQFIDSLKFNLKPFFGVLDSEDNIYIYGMNNGKLVHKFNPRGEYLFSFLDTVKSKNKRTEPHLNSMGRLGMTGDDRIYLALIYPYTIYIFNMEGKLLKQVVTETSYAVPPHQTDANIVIVNFHITGLDISPTGYIFCRNIFFDIPDKFDIEKLKMIYNSRFQKHSYIDLFDPEGNYLTHQRADGFSFGGIFDHQGNYYVITEDKDCFKMEKHSIQFKSH